LNCAVIAVTDSSEATARRLAPALDADVYRPARGELKDLVRDIFNRYEGLVFIMASGIVVRMIADLITDKYHDPAVVPVDDACRYAISPLSGHEGGANDLTWKVAALLGAEPVITTASDTNRRIVMGIGCRKGIDREDVTAAVVKILAERSLKAEDIRCAVSAEVKREESGLIEAMDGLGIPLLFQPMERLKTAAFPEMTPSEAAMRHFGIPGVREPCALLTARRGRLIMKRRKSRGVTVALAEEEL
jgi:cobalamin biosynthesis protein CbiG